MPKQDQIEEDIQWPLPGRVGVRSRHIINENENELNNLGNFRMQYQNYKTAPTRTKPLNPSLFGGEDFLRRAVGGNAAKLGWSHPKTVESLVDLALAQKAQGRPQEAEALLKKAYQEQCRIYGPCHPCTLNTSIILAECLESQLELNTWFQDEENLEFVRSMIPSKDIETQVHGDASTVDRERIPTSQIDLIQNILELRQGAALAFEEQYGANHGTTIRSVKCLSVALYLYATTLNNPDRGCDIRAHADHLRRQAEKLQAERQGDLPLDQEIFVPQYQTGHKSGKGQPPVPSISTRINDFTPGHAGVMG